MKGKKGPRPSVKSRKEEAEEDRPVVRYACQRDGCEFLGTLDEWSAHRSESGHGVYVMKQVMLDKPNGQDRSAEDIVGPENVVDVGDPGLVPGEEPLPEPQGYRCSDPGCTFSSPSLSEIEEHCNGTGHGGYKTYQPELFREPGVVHRNVQVKLADDLLAQKKDRLADLYQKQLEVRDEKKSADDDFNARLKNIDTQMQEIARVLKTPFTYEPVDCEWKILDGENARGLYRKDTGEMIEKQPLTAEDMAAEHERAAEQNAQQEEGATA